MATIPTYQQRTSVGGGLQLAPINPAVAGAPAAAGAALGGAASDLARDVVTVREFERQQKEERAAVWANEQSMSNRSRWVARLPELMQSAPEDGAGFTKQALEEFDANSAEIVKGAPTENARNWMRQNLASQRLALQEEGTSFELQRGVAFKINGLSRAADAARISAEARPQDFATLGASQVAAIRASGLSPAAQAEMIQKSMDALGGAAVEGMIRHDPYAALKEINNEKTGNLAVRALNFDTRQNMRAAAEREIRQREVDARQRQSEERQELGERVRDATAAYRLGLDFDAPPSRAEFVSALGGKDGTKAFESFQREKQLGADLAQLARLAPADQAALLNRRAPGQTLSHDGYPAIRNADGSVSTELGITVESEGLNNGRPTNIPSIWQGAKQTKAKAIEFARASGRTFEAFDSIDDAVAASKAHSQDLGRRIAGEGTAEAAERYRVLAGQAEQLHRQLDADPAAYAARYSPRVQAAFAAAQESPEAARAYATATIAEQKRLGVERPQILPEKAASSIAQSFYTQNGEQVAALIQSEQQKWGQHWPQVFGELAAKKIPPAALAIGRGMEPGAAVRLAGVSATPIEELKKGVETPVSDVREKIAGRMADFQSSLDGVIGAENTFSGMYDAVERLSYSYLRQGKSVGDATEQAYSEVLGDHYAFRDVNGRTFRVPIEEDSDDIERGAQSALERIKPVDLQPPFATATSSAENAQSDLARAVEKRGYWVTSADNESGLTLFLDGAPVLRVDGSVYSLGWDQLRAEHTAEQQRVREQRDAALKARAR